MNFNEMHKNIVILISQLNDFFLQEILYLKSANIACLSI